jgi:hypothetical protein
MEGFEVARFTGDDPHIEGHARHSRRARTPWDKPRAEPATFARFRQRFQTCLTAGTNK